MKKRILGTIIGVCMILSLAQIPALAASPFSYSTPVSTAKWDNTMFVDLFLKRQSGTVSWTGEIQGYQNTTNITATYTLYKQNSNGSYTFVDSWKDSTTTSTYLKSSGSVSGTAGTYKLSVSGTVTRNGSVESISSQIVMALS